MQWSVSTAQSKYAVWPGPGSTKRTEPICVVVRGSYFLTSWSRVTGTVSAHVQLVRVIIKILHDVDSEPAICYSPAKSPSNLLERSVHSRLTKVIATTSYVGLVPDNNPVLESILCVV